MSTGEFRLLLDRVRRGEADACAELVEKYGPAILREARHRLGTGRVRGFLDSEDIC